MNQLETIDTPADARRRLQMGAAATAAPAAQSAAADQDAVDLRRLWFAFRRRVRLFAIIALAVLLATVFFNQQLVAQYTASARILLDPREMEIVDIESVIGGLAPDAATIDTEVELISSRELMGRVVDQLRLISNPEFNYWLREPSGLSAVTGSLGDAVSSVVGSFLPGGAEEEVVEPISDERMSAIQREAVVNTLTRHISVRRVGMTYVINVQVESVSPDTAAQIANEVAEQYIVDQLEANLEATRRANAWLNERLVSMREEVRAAERAVEKFRAEAGLLDTGGETLTEQQIAEVSAQLVIQRADLAEREARLSIVRSQLAEGRSGDQFADVINDENVRDLRRQRAALSRELADLSTRYAEKHPRIIAKRRELADSERELQDETSRILSNLESEAEVARERVASLERDLARRRDRLAANKTSLVRLRELERDAEAVRGVYESFLERSRQTSAQVTLEETQARIIAKATPPLYPSSPNRKLNLFVGVMLALTLGGAAVFAAETFDSGLRTSADVDRFLNFPTLGMLPRIRFGTLKGRNVRGVADYVVARPLSAYSEALRAVRASVLLGSDGPEVRTLSFTSAISGEGKTSVAYSFARVSAMQGARTLAIDCDLRRRELTRAAGLEPQRGLIEVLKGQESATSAVVEETDTGLHILPLSVSGGTQHDFAGLGGMRQLLDQVRQEYDLVVLDTAPVLAVTESRVLGTLVDCVVVIAQWRHTARNAVRSAIGALTSVGAPVAGVVLTKVNLRLQSQYADEGGYYHRSYRKYYED
ncbi:MAG: polysaccharide biosynthesis tyrosine autokinase [Caulobacterales bacterium]|nr:polysaccharide biosynthesis tyrosine autokinase [Caulobacterales bacterium]